MLISTRKVIEHLGLPTGYRIEQQTSSHYRIIRPDGTPLRSAAGIPITVACTPSDWRGRKNEIARIRRALRC